MDIYWHIMQCTRGVMWVCSFKTPDKTKTINCSEFGEIWVDYQDPNDVYHIMNIFEPSIHLKIIDLNPIAISPNSKHMFVAFKCGSIFIVKLDEWSRYSTPIIFQVLKMKYAINSISYRNNRLLVDCKNGKNKKNKVLKFRDPVIQTETKLLSILKKWVLTDLAKIVVNQLWVFSNDDDD